MKIFKNTLEVIGWALSAFSFIGIIVRYNEVGLNGIFADLYAWHHAVAQAIFNYILAWPVFLIWPRLDVPGWIVDAAVALFALTVIGSRVTVAHVLETSERTPALPIQRFLAHATLAVIFYVVCLIMTITLAGPAFTLWSISKGGALALGWPKGWTLIVAEDEISRMELRKIYVRTFWGAVFTVAAVLAFFVLNAYAPGALAELPAPSP